MSGIRYVEQDFSIPEWAVCRTSSSWFNCLVGRWPYILLQPTVSAEFWSESIIIRDWRSEPQRQCWLRFICVHLPYSQHIIKIRFVVWYSVAADWSAQ